MQKLFLAVKVVAMLSYLALFLSTIQSKAERSVRLLFSVYVVGMMFWQFTSLMVSLSDSAEKALLWYNLAVAGTGTVNLLFYPFARAFTKGRSRGILVTLAYVSCGLMFVAGILGLTFREVVIGRGGYWVPVYDSKWLLIFGPIWYFFYGCGIVVLVKALFRERSPERRNRIKYVLAGASFVVVGISTNLTMLRDYPVDITFNLLSALAIGFAVIRYRLLDIRVVLVRSLYYSVMTASLIAAYVGLIFGLESLLARGVGYSRSIYGIVAVILLAFVFLPLRNALQALIDRVFFREKEDYQRKTQQFSREIASLYEEAAIVRLVGETLSATVKTTFTALSLYDPVSRRYVVKGRYGPESELATGLDEEAQSALVRRLRKEGKPLLREEALFDPEARHHGDPNPSMFSAETVSVVVPVLLDERLFGMIVLGPKLSGIMYSAEDRSFLATIANQAATALDKSEIFRKIQRRLSEQTLLFVLSEKFRSSSDFDTVMAQVVVVLKSFLNSERCAIVYFDEGREARIYAEDRLSDIAADLATRAWAGLEARGEARDRGVLDLGAMVGSLAAARDDLDAAEKRVVASLSYRFLADGDRLLGLLALSERTATGSDREDELLGTIQAIVSQGIVLHRTIVDLQNLESYNERVLESLNDMGDTLVILDAGGRIKRVNKAACKLLDYPEEELLGALIGDFVADDGGLLSPEGLRDLLGNKPVSNRELSYRKRGGVLVPMLFSGSAIGGEDGRSPDVIGIARDMTERRKAEDAAKNLLLVQEIHHRIKNNLQVISSLLNLQAGYVADPRVKEMFRESQNRVRSMALIHEKLYRSETASSMDFSEYVDDLARNLMTSYSLRPSKVAIETEVSDVRLGIDTAVPCSLIINELVSNAFKHAFPGERTGRIFVRMRRIVEPAAEAVGGRDCRYELVVEDDGVGFPAGVDFHESTSLGLRIVTTLCSQLHGEIEMERIGGTRFRIHFSELR
jgi:PAS domain S-box-containing protein